MKKIENDAWLIVFVLFAILGCLFGGCDNPQPVPKNYATDKEGISSPDEVSIYEYQGHEYIRFDVGNYSWGGHYPECPNPIHKCKCN